MKLPAQNAIYTEVVNGKERYFFWSNAKYLCIFLVILSHLSGAVTGLWTGAYIIIGMVTIVFSAFFLISGYFSSSGTDARRSSQRALGMSVLYVVIMLWLFFQDQFCYEIKTGYFLYSRGAAWFLQAMVIWSLVTPGAHLMKKRTLMALSIMLGLAIGFDPRAGHYASIQRIFSYFPVFAIGICLSDRDFASKSRPFSIKMAALCYLVALAIAIDYTRPAWLLNMVRGISSYDAMKLSPLAGVSLRTLYYPLVFVALMAFLVLVPRRKLWISEQGNQTLSIYFFHMPVYEYLNRTGLTVQIFESFGYLALIAISIALCWLFSRSPFTAAVAYLNDTLPKRILFKK